MKNFKTERERLEKGCGEGFGYDDKYICKKNDLCPTCQAKLTQLNEDEEICREEIDKSLDKINWDEKQGCSIFGDKTMNKIKRELKQNLFGGEK